MTEQLQDHLARGEARIVDAPASPARHQVEVDRTFELPGALYVATVGCYLAFLGIMLIGLANPVLIIPMVIFSFLNYWERR